MLKNIDLIKKLVGESVSEDDLKYVDCYVHNNLGLFIPSVGSCQYAIRPKHTHPAYMFIIVFSEHPSNIQIDFNLREDHYFATALSPDIPHEERDDIFTHYYCIMIDKEYFDSQYSMYSDKIPDFNWKTFAICHDILKALNTFAFEYSKNMKNSHITLDAQSTIITHWLIRSIMGETYDMGAISSNYAVARAEHYIEEHFNQTITVSQLAELGNMSLSSFNRVFKKETRQTPKEYIIDIRIEKSKKLLRRNEIPITEVAFRCGFSSSSHFSHSFNQKYNMTPSEYRNTYCY